MFIPYIKAAGFETLPERSKLEDIISALRNSCEILSDISKFIGIFLNEINEPDEETDSHLKEDYAIDIIKICNELIEQITPDEISSFISKVKEKSPHKGKKLFHPIRAIVTGRLSGPELDIVIPIIGFDKLKKRIKYAYSRYC
jgi:nondiscriminating glutamyl-tRNA synthetase